MKNFNFKLIVICLFMITTKQYAQICSFIGAGNLPTFIFNNQAQIDYFLVENPACTTIYANILIHPPVVNGQSTNSDITNLQAFQNITSIKGKLYVGNNQLLTNFEGLNNLAQVGSLEISNNIALHNFQGLESLSLIDYGPYQFDTNSFFKLRGNTSLASFEGLDSLTNVKGTFEVQSGCPNLSDFTGLESLTDVDGISFTSSGILSFNGLDNLAHVHESIVIQTTSIENFEGLENLNTIDADITIRLNPSLISLQGLSGLQEVQLLAIQNNNNLTSLSGINNLTTLQSLAIVSNPALVSMDGFTSLTTLSGNFSINTNNALTSIATGNTLTSVGGEIRVSNNPVLANLSILNTVSSQNSLRIENNDSLESLDGLENITITNSLIITSSNNLSLCALPNICTYLANGGTATISGNADGCNSIAQVALNCVAPICPPAGNLVFDSQQQLNDFILNYSSCIEINGNLTIGSLDGNTDITSLSALQNLTSINGNLLIVNNPLLENLTGLNAIETVVGSVTIGAGNTLLNSIDALSNLASIDGALQILYNPALTSLQGLESVNPLTIGGLGLNIIGNGNLTFCNLANICEYIGYDVATFPRSISGNAAGCSSVVGIQAACLGNLCPEGNLSFSSQALLDQFILDYPNCTEINGNLFISGATITNLAPLQNITSITGNLTIHFCANLLSLQPLENLESVGGNVYISTLINLNSLSGLQNLIQVGGNLSVVFNSSLTNLQGLNGISAINNNYIYIANNNALTSLSGLQDLNLDTITHLYIQDNPNLSNCSILSNICAYLQNGGAATISGNTGDCLSAIAVQNTCLTIWYADSDSDGFGNSAQAILAGSQPVGYVSNNTDCDDTRNFAYPGATEICWNNIDDNCNKIKSEGCLAIPVFVNNPVTITNFATHLSAVPYTYAGAMSLDYRYEVTNISVIPNQTRTFTQTGTFARYFTIPVDIRGFDTDYTIRASAVINGEEVPYVLSVITVRSTGIPTVKLSPTSCGVTLSQLNATIAANPGFNATSYEFRIRLTSDNGATPTYYYAQSPSRFIGANSFNGLSLQYGTSYSLSVRYATSSIGATATAVTSDYGDECILTTPSIPLISLSSPICGIRIDRFGATIAASPATYAQQYQFRIRLTSDNGETPMYYFTIPSASRYSSLVAAQGLVLADDTQYSVSVRYSIPVVGGGTVFSEYGSECNIQTPGATVARIQGTPFRVVAHPNPFSEGFQLDVKTENDGLASIKTYDMIGRLIEERSSKVNKLESISIGANYPSGVYNVIVSQEDEVKTIRVIKR